MQHYGKIAAGPLQSKPEEAPASCGNLMFYYASCALFIAKGECVRSYLVILVLFVLGSSTAQEGSFSYYCSFSHEPTILWYYGDSTVYNGPFRANGPIWLYSMTPGRDNDPWFQSLTLSSDYYLCGPMKQPAVAPQCGDLWIEPYELMVQGPPWFTLGTDPLPFGPDQVDWQALRATAIDHGLFLSESQVPNNWLFIISHPRGHGF
jgi:hypothetical protein